MGRLSPPDVIQWIHLWGGDIIMRPFFLALTAAGLLACGSFASAADMPANGL